jgi:hypothetical protein
MLLLSFEIKMNTAKISEAKGTPSSKRRGPRFWLGCLALVLGLPLLIYYGYCWGLWGRHSLLLHYLFQCSCPPASEEARYPKEVDVIIPACQKVNTLVRLSPSGRFLYLREEKESIPSAYLLDLQTMERVKVNDQSFSSFLTDDLWFDESGVEGYIIDRINAKRYPIKTFRFWRADASINGAPNLELLRTTLREAEHIIFTQNNDSVIVLMSKFPTSLEENFTFDRSDIPGGDSNKVEQFLQENNISYQTVLADFPHEVLSPDGKLIARDDGIYLAETNQIIVKAPVSLVRGWTPDGLGAIYASGSHCLFQIGLPFSDDSTCFRRVPQPVFKLLVPKEYLASTQIP